ncbi:putative set domain-containing protein [Mycena kentingensis (nom. inval.)]|nr:putative set domain-containing protein [Mycena kentingensis (nom. inval.)]
MSIDPTLQNTTLPPHLAALLDTCFSPDAAVPDILATYTKRPKPSQLKARLTPLFVNPIQNEPGLLPAAIRAANATWDSFTEGSVAPSDFLRSPIGAAYRVTNVAGKGRGMVATRTIQAGERVLVESPTSVLIDRQLNALCFLFLPKQALHALMLLHNAQPHNSEFTAHEDIPHHRLLDYMKGIASSNAFSIKLENGSKAGIVTLAGSLFNHASVPNVHGQFDSNAFAMVFRAIATVHEGEELCVSYGSDAAVLSSNYGISV